VIEDRVKRCPAPKAFGVETAGDVIGVIINEDGVTLSSFIFPGAPLTFAGCAGSARVISTGDFNPKLPWIRRAKATFPTVQHLPGHPA
jgi:hypothetical protein